MTDVKEPKKTYPNIVKKLEELWSNIEDRISKLSTLSTDDAKAQAFRVKINAYNLDKEIQKELNYKWPSTPISNFLYNAGDFLESYTRFIKEGSFEHSGFMVNVDQKYLDTTKEELIDLLTEIAEELSPPEAAPAAPSVPPLNITAGTIVLSVPPL